MERPTNKKLGERICIELKSGRKYFGILKEIDESPKQFSWYILDVKGIEMNFNDGEILRVEVLD